MFLLSLTTLRKEIYTFFRERKPSLVENFVSKIDETSAFEVLNTKQLFNNLKVNVICFLDRIFLFKNIFENY